jgi:hypothetical protein
MQQLYPSFLTASIACPTPSLLVLQTEALVEN